MAITVTETAAKEVRRIVSDQQQAGTAPDKLYLRMRVVGGGCSGFEHKLDLDTTMNEDPKPLTKRRTYPAEDRKDCPDERPVAGNG
jgi:iron-sulfur cluster assembly protein